MRPVAETFRYIAEESQRLDAFLSRASGRSRAFVQRHIEGGLVCVNGVPARKTGERLKAGDVVTGRFEPRPATDVRPEPGKLHVLYEDESLLAINKPQGIAVHPSAGHGSGTVVHFLLHHLKDQPQFHALDAARPGIVHRLDLGTSGVLVIAKTLAAQEGLARQFKDRTLQKEYECLAWGNPGPSGRIALPIGRHRIDRKKMSSRAAKSRDALTEWRRLRQFRDVCHLALFPKTGRTHQLRVHLSETGFPIVADALYARRSAEGLKGRLAPEVAAIVQASPHPFLHARRLTFAHPISGETVTVEAPPPPLFWELLTSLEKFDK